MSGFTTAELLAAAAEAPRAGRLLAARQEVWRRLVEAGLVWQPGIGHEYGGGRGALTLSSPTEWTAEHWKDAALHVLKVEEALRAAGWTLGLLEARRVQFVRCRPVWISQTALLPLRQELRQEWKEFVGCFLNPLLDECADGNHRGGRRGWIGRLCARTRRLAGLTARDAVAELRETVERVPPRRQWSPWRSNAQPPEAAGPAAILAREEAMRRGAGLVYEWRSAGCRSAALQACPGAAWIRFHESADEAAADYLEQRAAQGEALPLWNSTGDPMAACPGRAEADLLIATGRGNAPVDERRLAGFARVIRRMARAAVVEFVPEEGGAGWEAFGGTLRSLFRIARTDETGAGRRLCVLERE